MAIFGLYPASQTWNCSYKKSEPFANKMIDIFAGIPAQSVCLLRKHRLAAAALLGGTLCVVNHA
jgi:hypothetical protein